MLSVVRYLNNKALKELGDALLQIHAPGNLKDFPHRALEAVQRLIPCDVIGYNEFGPKGIVGIIEPEAPRPAAMEVFCAYVNEHPSLSYVQRTGSQESVRISDFAPQKQWRNTNLYNGFFRPMELNYQLGSLFAVGPMRIGFAMNRKNKDFTDEECALLDLLGPHLVQAWHSADTLSKTERVLAGVGVIEVDRQGRIQYSTDKAQRLLLTYFESAGSASGKLPNGLLCWFNQNVQKEGDARFETSAPLIVDRSERRLVVGLSSSPGENRYRLLLDEKETVLSPSRLEPLGLTRRETEVLFWISRGKTNREIAVILGLSGRTVDKHIENIISKLCVENRTSAAAIALELLN